MEEAVKSLGYEVAIADSGEKALAAIRAGSFDVLLTDMQMPGMDGLALLSSVMRYDPSVSVIVVTAHGTIETAVDAMKRGAEDYLLKPVEFEALDLILKRVFGKRDLVRENKKLMSENEALKRDLGIKFHLANAIGKSPQSQKTLEEVKKYMKNRAPVLVLGEQGVGRDDIARMIHYNSPWARSDLIVFDTAHVPEEFHENHLFGEELTIEGGVKTPSRPGLVEKAHMSTLLVMDIHKLHERVQPLLSKVIREEKSQRIGGQKFYHAYVRLIATSTKPEFEKAAESKEFRKDIYDLLRENTIEIAPLRERKEDIPLLIAAAAKRIGGLVGKEIKKIDKDVIDNLAGYDFPGNNHELDAMVESAVIRCNEETLKWENFARPGTQRAAPGAQKK